MEADELADQVQYDVLENVNPDLSDSEFIDRPDALDAATPGFGGSEMGDMPTLGGDLGDRDEDGEEGDEDGDEGDGDIDEDLAAELDLALGDDEEGEGDDEDEEEDESDEDDEDDDDDEAVQAKKLLNEEIRDLEAAVAKKNHEIASSANPLIRVCMRLSLIIFVFDMFVAATFRGCSPQTAGRLGHKVGTARRIERETAIRNGRRRCARRFRWT